LLSGQKDGTTDLLRLPLNYILAFTLAEAAFVWMALKEYIQDILGITDHDLMARPPPASAAGSEGNREGTPVSDAAQSSVVQG